MSGIVISGGSSRSTEASGAMAGGSAAEQELQRAQKAYTKAVQKLMKDAADRVDTDVIEMDRLAVDSAASAVARAQAAVGREQAQRSEGAAPAGEGRGRAESGARTDVVDISTERKAGPHEPSVREDDEGDRTASAAHRSLDRAAERSRFRADELLAAVLSLDIRV